LRGFPVGATGAGCREGARTRPRAGECAKASRVLGAVGIGVLRSRSCGDPEERAM
jgi:hypothetical protein